MPKKFLISQRSLLEKRPLVIGTLVGQGALPPQMKKAASPYVDVVEVRLDGFREMYRSFQIASSFATNLLKQTRRLTRKPILLTFRSANEQGAKKLASKRTDSERGEILVRLLPLCEMIDVEIQSMPMAKKLTILARHYGRDVIHSFHRFSGPFDYSLALELSRRSMALKGEVFKIAMMPRTKDELEKFLSWGRDLKNPYRVLIGMGPLGAVSRILGYSFGSVLTYGHLGVSAAPGQMAAPLLGQKVRALYAS